MEYGKTIFAFRAKSQAASAAGLFPSYCFVCVDDDICVPGQPVDVRGLLIRFGMDFPVWFSISITAPIVADLEPIRAQLCVPVAWF